MELQTAEKIVRAMATERGVRPHVIISEYLKHRDTKNNICSHFWPDQNSACFKMVSILEQLRES